MPRLRNVKYRCKWCGKRNKSALYCSRDHKDKFYLNKFWRVDELVNPLLNKGVFAWDEVSVTI